MILSISHLLGSILIRNYANDLKANTKNYIILSYFFSPDSTCSINIPSNPGSFGKYTSKNLIVSHTIFNCE